MALEDVISGAISVWDAAELMDRLPSGSAIWREIGGARALTSTEQMLRALEFQTRVNTWMQSKDGASGKNRPEPLPLPKGIYEDDIKATVRSERIKRHDARRAERLERLKKQAEAEQQDH